MWDSLRDAIINDYRNCKNMHAKFILSDRLQSRHLPNFFVLNNQKCDNVTVNGNELSDTFKDECLHTINTLSNYAINSGYLCSTCDPLFILTCQIFKVDIKHTHYNGFTTIYKYKGNGRCVYNFESNISHIWYINK